MLTATDGADAGSSIASMTGESGTWSAGAGAALAGRLGIFGGLEGKVYGVDVSSLPDQNQLLCTIAKAGKRCYLRCAETKMDRTVFLVFIHDCDQLALSDLEILERSAVVVLIIRVGENPPSFQDRTFKLFILVLQAGLEPVGNDFGGELAQGAFRKVYLELHIGVSADGTCVAGPRLGIFPYGQIGLLAKKITAQRDRAHWL